MISFADAASRARSVAGGDNFIGYAFGAGAELLAAEAEPALDEAADDDPAVVLPVNVERDDAWEVPEPPVEEPWLDEKRDERPALLRVGAADDEPTDDADDDERDEPEDELPADVERVARLPVVYEWPLDDS